MTSITSFCRALPTCSRLPLLVEAREAQSCSVMGRAAHERIRSTEINPEQLVSTHDCLAHFEPLTPSTTDAIYSAMREMCKDDWMNAAAVSNVNVSAIATLFSHFCNPYFVV